MSEIEHIQFNMSVSVLVEHNADGTYTAYPEYAEHVRYTEDSRAEAIRGVLMATADAVGEDL